MDNAPAYITDWLTTESSQGTDSWEVRGFQEVIFCIKDAEAARLQYESITGWSTISDSSIAQDQLTFWNINTADKTRQIVLHNPHCNRGYLRLCQFDNLEQEYIRSSSQSWDTGGIYDVDVRVTNLGETFDLFRSFGWTAYNDPIEYVFGDFHISEVLVHGYEDIVFALIQRHQPELQGYPHLRKVSHIFNSSQIVTDIEKSKDFYINKLGFKVYMDKVLKGTDKDENLFGVPQNIYQNIERKICILSPDGKNFGSVELIELDGIMGKDYSSRAHPPNLGIMTLRFPCRDVDNYKKRFSDEEIRGYGLVDIPPYGLCKTLAIQSPDGAWLEFIELL